MAELLLGLAMVVGLAAVLERSGGHRRVAWAVTGLTLVAAIMAAGIVHWKIDAIVAIQLATAAICIVVGSTMSKTQFGVAWGQRTWTEQQYVHRKRTQVFAGWLLSIVGGLEFAVALAHILVLWIWLLIAGWLLSLAILGHGSGAGRRKPR